MNLDELRSVQRTERQKDTLQHLRDTFYGDVGEYIEELKTERDRIAAEADEPFSNAEVGRLSDEIETAEEVVESVYERRVGKVVKLATFAAADMQTDEEGLTAEERDLYGDLVSRIRTNREAVLATLSGGDAGDALDVDSGGDTDGADADGSATDGSTAEGGAIGESGRRVESDVLAEAMGGDGSSPREGEVSESTPPDATGDTGDAAEGRPSRDGGDRPEGDERSTGGDAPDRERSGDTDRTTVRITRDVGEILGVDDREYELAAEDVVTLPATNAEPLVERGAAERLD